MPAIISGVTVALVVYLARRISKLISTIADNRQEAITDAKRREETSEMILMWNLRNIIWAPYFSFDEKREAYKLYRERGGNHLTEAHFRELEQEQIKKMEGKYL